MRYSVRVDPLDHGLLPPYVELTPSWFSVSDEGGSDRAEILVAGPVDSLHAIDGLLGAKIHIYNEFGQNVWRGIVTGAETTIGGVTSALRLDHVYNTIRVLYTLNQESFTTDWASDAISIAQYGASELQETMNDVLVEAAEALRDELLDSSSLNAKTSFGADTDRGVLTARGVWSFNERRYYENLSGEIDLLSETSGTQSIGWEQVATGWVFYNGKLHQIDGKVAGIQDRDRILIAGSAQAGVNGIWDVTGDPSPRSVITYTGTDVSFTSQDKIHRPDSWDGFVSRQLILVSGSTANDGPQWLLSVNNNDASPYLSVDTGWNRINMESAGATVTVQQGMSVGLDGIDELSAMYTETLTVSLWGEELEQSFTSPWNGDASWVALKLQKHGSPTDSLRVNLCTDSSGSRGAVVAFADFDPALVSSTSQSTITVELSLPVSLTQNERYWLYIQRLGTDDGDNYLEVAMIDPVSGETCNLLLNGNWYEQTTQHLGFKLVAGADTRDLIETIATYCNPFLDGINFEFDVSTARRSIHYDGLHRGDTLINELIGMGGPNGRSLVVVDSPDFSVFIYERSSTPRAGIIPMWGQDGKLHGITGSPIPFSPVLVGDFVEFDARSTRELQVEYIGRAEVNPQTGEVILYPNE